MYIPNSRCKDCALCMLVTTYPTGRSIPEDERYYQCLEGGDCLPKDESINVYVDEELEVKPEPSLWVQFLQESGICHQDAVGNMPCDNGCVCDKCSAEWIQAHYHTWLDEHSEV